MVKRNLYTKEILRLMSLNQGPLWRMSLKTKYLRKINIDNINNNICLIIIITCD